MHNAAFAALVQVVPSRGRLAISYLTLYGAYASTVFWVDPVEDLIVVFMTQLMPSGTFNFRGQLKSLIYSAIVD